MIEDELRSIEELAQKCDNDPESEELSVELNLRLQEILDWLKLVLKDEK